MEKSLIERYAIDPSSKPSSGEQDDDHWQQEQSLVDDDFGESSQSKFLSQSMGDSRRGAAAYATTVCGANVNMFLKVCVLTLCNGIVVPADPSKNSAAHE